MIEVKIKEWGNSLGIILPIRELKKKNIQKGDTIIIDVKKKKRLDGFGIAKGSSEFHREKDDPEREW